MKKLDIISNKIQDNSLNYFGRGHFETIIKEKSSLVLEWLEELVPVQEQIKRLESLGCVDLQKRNYVRILTKTFPNEYLHFTSMNIILRDISSIATVFKGIHDTRKQYDTLLAHTKLKFPGKHNKYVDFHTYQQFVSFYKSELSQRADSFGEDPSIKIEPNLQYIYNIPTKKEEIEEKQEIENLTKNEIEEKQAVVENETSQKSQENETTQDTQNSKKTNWVNVLLKGV